MISLFCVYLFSFVVAQASLIDGQMVSGEMQSIDAKNLQIAIGDEVRSIPLESVETIVLGKSVDRPLTKGVTLNLRDGSTCFVTSLAISEQGQVTTNGGDSKLRFDLAQLGSVRYFAAANETLGKQWNEIVANRGSDDYLVINKKGNLDYLAGIVGGMDKQNLAFVYGGNRLDIPMARVAGLVFAKRPAIEARPRAVVTTMQGSVWQTREILCHADTCKLKSVGGVAYELPLSAVRSVALVRMGVEFLSDLEPESVEYRPYYRSLAVGEQLKALAAPKRDVSFGGQPIQIEVERGSLREFERGLAVQSRTELVYRLAKKYQRFQSTIGLDPTAPDQGNVEVTLFADGKEVFKRHVSKNDLAIDVDVSVADANRMKILIGFGKNLDIGDRLHLGGAKLTK